MILSDLFLKMILRYCRGKKVDYRHKVTVNWVCSGWMHGLRWKCRTLNEAGR